MHICSVILSGGKSSRMGTTKSLLEMDGKPVITHIADELKKCSHHAAVIANDPETYRFLGLAVYPDRYQNKGPLAGIETALSHIDADVYLFVACDMPFIHRDVYQYLLQSLYDADAVIPVYHERMHPLSGIYTKNVLPHIRKLLDRNQRKIRTLFEHIHVNYVTEFPGIPDTIVDKHFFNMNDPEQYEEAKRLT
ncbi:molybdopterin-guanine dinucleotide biosynthesis protein A [Lentibacillus halodurans]|uniref:Probable molybdenum cofactor guanylyltransferase n=1 Tax=Lentibacillus halodurans TaxID=237679 RepID=A0A1I0VEN5_9BACI|nr:molybdenum cofactor guanylyltransferase [Lentibacillus halodurans]SFA74688.1 molybdopterin-guanine dinucleotide biosynthesis protein A [Lentibacillus halodurans]